MKITKEIVLFFIYVVLLIAFCVSLYVCGVECEVTKSILELIKYVTVAVISFYFGRYSLTLKVTLRKNIANILARIGYIAIGAGLALVLHHVILYGCDWTILSHEWGGILLLTIGCLMVAYAKKHGVY